jgi:excisionase family DNA binding protein
LDHLTTEQTAKRLFTTQYTVRKYVRDSKLPAAKVGRHYLIAVEDLESFLASKVYKRQTDINHAG